MLERGAVIEHGSSRSGRWLRERRLRIALWVAVIEGIFIVFHQIPVAVAIVLGIAVVVLYFTAGDRLSGTAGQVAWIAAVSQVLVMLVPIFLIVFASIALFIVAILAVGALVLLFSSRR